MKNSYFARILALISICAIFLAYVLLPISASSSVNSPTYFKTSEVLPFDSLYIKDNGISYKISTLRSEVYDESRTASTSINNSHLTSANEYAKSFRIAPNIVQIGFDQFMGETMSWNLGVDFKLPYSEQPNTIFNRIEINASAGVAGVFLAGDAGAWMTLSDFDNENLISAEKQFFVPAYAGDSFRRSNITTAIDPSILNITVDQLRDLMFPLETWNTLTGLDFKTTLMRTYIEPSNVLTHNVNYQIDVSNASLQNFGNNTASFNLQAHNFALTNELTTLQNISITLQGFKTMTNISYKMRFSYIGESDYVEQTDVEDTYHFYDIKSRDGVIEWEKSVNLSEGGGIVLQIFNQDFVNAFNNFKSSLANASPPIDITSNNFFVTEFSMEFSASKNPIYENTTFEYTYNEHKAAQQTMEINEWLNDNIDITYWEKVGGGGGGSGSGGSRPDNSGGIFEWLISPLDAFLNVNFFGTFSFATIIWVIIGIAVVFAFLKYFAGG